MCITLGKEYIIRGIWVWSLFTLCSCGFRVEEISIGLISNSMAMCDMWVWGSLVRVCVGAGWTGQTHHTSVGHWWCSIVSCTTWTCAWWFCILSYMYCKLELKVMMQYLCVSDVTNVNQKWTCSSPARCYSQETVAKQMLVPYWWWRGLTTFTITTIAAATTTSGSAYQGTTCLSWTGVNLLCAASQHEAQCHALLVGPHLRLLEFTYFYFFFYLADLDICCWRHTTSVRFSVAVHGDHLPPHSQPPLTSSFGDKEQAFGCCSYIVHRASPIFILNKIFLLTETFEMGS